MIAHLEQQSLDTHRCDRVVQYHGRESEWSSFTHMGLTGLALLHVQNTEDTGPAVASPAAGLLD